MKATPNFRSGEATLELEAESALEADWIDSLDRAARLDGLALITRGECGEQRSATLEPDFRARHAEWAKLRKPVSGAAMADAASAPGYNAPELREQAAQAAPRPARPSPRTERCIGCRGTGQGVPAPQSHARVCPDYTQEDEAWCLTKYWADNRGTMISYEEALESVRRDSKYARYARYAPPRADGVGEVQVKVGEQAAPRDLPERWPWPAVRAALKLIDPGSVRIAMDRDTMNVSGPLTASAKADPEAAFLSIPDLRERAQ